MKPFTFMIVVLGLILAFLYVTRHLASVPDPTPPPNLVFFETRTTGPDGRPIGTRSSIQSIVAAAPDAEDEREEAEGLPVRIVPGTRVTEARIGPPGTDEGGVLSPEQRPPGGKDRNRNRTPRGAILAHSSTIRLISSQLSATEDRARENARLQLQREVTEWLTPEVPTSWRPPAHLVTRMIRRTDVQPIVKDYGTVYEATLQADFSSPDRGVILAAYRRELVARRLAILGGSLGFVLACLAALAGYIRADEATRGYYTHWLRVVAAAGVGATGMFIYHILT